MAKETNIDFFEALPDTEYFKDNKRASQKFRNIEAFANALGLDMDTSGFIALHHKHVDLALLQELPVCIILKNAGYGVVLMNEEGIHQKADAQIDGQLFEIKRISKAKNIQGAITY